ncbi:hypothetical protein QYG89_05950 [Bacillus sp. B190/17]|uniref:Uncharacterized protein n=1 Tax=Bacillus lumedeiriae TaxID=3058829 RepID=A0ABW8I6V6_9BACI
MKKITLRMKKIFISLYPQDGKYATTLIKKADEFMYKTKHHRKNGYQFAEVSADLAERGI